MLGYEVGKLSVKYLAVFLALTRLRMDVIVLLKANHMDSYLSFFYVCVYVCGAGRVYGC